MYWFLWNLFMENKDALLSLPQEVKIILLVSLAIFIGTAILKKAWRFAKIAALVAVGYFVLAGFGVL